MNKEKDEIMAHKSELLGDVLKMDSIVVRIPSKTQILSFKTISLKTAARNEKWDSSPLKDYEKKCGIYIHHDGKKILYVGETTGESQYGNYKGRLQREFIESYSKESHLYQSLCKINKIYTVILDYEKINSENLIESEIVITNKLKTLILEQCLIAAYDPEFNMTK